MITDTNVRKDHVLIGRFATDALADAAGNRFRIINGAIYYNTTEKIYKAYKNSVWVPLYNSLNDGTYELPARLSVMSQSAVTCADGSHDDATISKLNIATGNTVSMKSPDLGAAAGSSFAVLNLSGGDLEYEPHGDDTPQEGYAKITLVNGGFLVIYAAANDSSIIIESAGIKSVTAPE